MARKHLPIRNQVVAMLATPGIRHEDIAKSLKCSIRTIARIAKDVTPDIHDADSKLAAIQKELGSVITLKQRAEKYAELATSAKNEAVSLGALQRIDDIDGILVKKDELRLKQDSGNAHQPMFMLPPGTSVQVTVNTATPQPVVDTTRTIDVTPEVEPQVVDNTDEQGERDHT